MNKQIDTFLSEHQDAIELPIDAAWGLARGHGRQILTGESAMDGFYYARLSKKNQDDHNEAMPSTTINFDV